MGLLKLNEILRPCVGQNWAVGAFDTPNLDITQAILDGAVAEQAPVIFMVLPVVVCQDQWPGLVALIQAEVGRRNIPAAILLDHGTTVEQVQCALDLGFSGVMIDASTKPLEENIALTRQVVAMAHAKGVPVEAELGHVGGGQEVLNEDEQQARLTPVDEAERFVQETGIDALAVSIGTAHGLYRVKPQLDLERLAQIRRKVSLPLVLHGSSDTPDPQVRQAVEIGIDKVNVWTDVRLPYLRAMQAALAVPAEKVDVLQATATAQAAAREVVQHKLRLFNSAGKADRYA
jgi:fructose-bisphosphate aldolase, class II